MRCCGLIFLLLALAGCGGPSFDVVPVSGVVTLDGKPLAGARIGFEPRRSGDERIAGPGSYAKTDSAGRYRLESLDGEPGAVVATHDVTISTSPPQADPASEEDQEIADRMVPERYFEPGALTCTVTPPGRDDADFHLTTQ
jgi:hypothetical protein